MKLFPSCFLNSAKRVALFTRAWIEMTEELYDNGGLCTSPSSRGRGLKLFPSCVLNSAKRSPSSRGRGLKCVDGRLCLIRCYVALFTRAWIEIRCFLLAYRSASVALFTRAWIEILTIRYVASSITVALFTRAWIEITL